MTISTSSNKTIALGNGSQTQFAFSFVGVAAAFISVIGQEHPPFDRPRRQGGNRFAGEDRPRPDRSPARQCATVPDRNRSRHGDALCGSRAKYARP